MLQIKKFNLKSRSFGLVRSKALEIVGPALWHLVVRSVTLYPLHRSNPPPTRAFTSVAVRGALSSTSVLPRGTAVAAEEEGDSRGLEDRRRRLDPQDSSGTQDGC